MRIFRIGLFVLLCATAFQTASGFATKHVVILIMDGARFTETWGDASHANIPNIAALASQGTIFTNFRTTIPGNIAITETCPGHARITTGTIQNIANNGTELPSQPGIFQEYLKQKMAPASSAWLITSKDKLFVLSNSSAPGWNNQYRPLFNSGVNGDGTGGYREDNLTQPIVLQKLQADKPALMLVNYKGPDAMGHANNWDGYLAAIREVDGYVREVWDLIQATPGLKDSTVMFVLPDHGRHTNDFTSHGDDCEGCCHLFCLALGSNIKGGMTNTTMREQRDFAPTIGRLLGFSMAAAQGVVMSEILDTVTTDDTPPQIVETAPGDTVCSTAVTLSATTDEPARLRWSLADQSYAAMPNQFGDGEGTREHRTTVIVEHGRDYTCYVRAIDDRGNAMPASAVISFHVDTTFTLVAWNQNGYDPARAAWRSGPAELGYGDGDEATTVSFGPSSNARYITTYFRSEFQISDPAATGDLGLTIRYDDGAVIYINGQELTRINMPDGTITNETRSATVGADNAEQTLTVPRSLLRNGTNAIAVSVHQQDVVSTDISFDLALSGGGSTQIGRGATWYYWDQGTTPVPMLYRDQTTVTMRTPGVTGIVDSQMRVSVSQGMAVFRLATPSAADGILQLYDCTGRIVAYRQVSKNSIRVAMPTEGLATGLYVAALEQDGATCRVPLIIEGR
jgi:hypothetical protein